MQKAYATDITTDAAKFTASYQNLQDFASNVASYYYACIRDTDVPFFLRVGATNNNRGMAMHSSTGYYNVPLVGIGTDATQSANLLHAVDYINAPSAIQEFNGGQTGDYTTFRLVNDLKLSTIRTTTPNIQIRMFCHSSADPATIPYTNVDTDRYSYTFATWEQFMAWLSGDYAISYTWRDEQFNFSAADFPSDHPYINTTRIIDTLTFEFIFFVLNFKTDLMYDSVGGYISGIMPSVIIDNNAAMDWDILNPNPTKTKILVHGNVYRPYAVAYEDPYYNINGDTFGNLFANTYNPWPPAANMTFYASDYAVGQVNADKHFYIDGRFILVYSDSTYNWGFFAWSDNDIRFYCALIPYLSNGIGKSYYPLIEDNVIKGHFFESSELADKGTPWQKSDVLSPDTNTYTPDDMPQPIDNDDDITTAVHNDQNSLPFLSDLRFVSGDAFTTYYALAAGHVANLGQMLSSMPSSFWQALGTATDDTQSNLLQYIISLKWYPIDILNLSGLYIDTVTTSLQFGFNGIGKLDLPNYATSYKLSSITRTYNMGSIAIPPRSAVKTYLDMEPYTTITAYLPYVGNFTLQAIDVIGKTLTCTYIIDLTTGMCTSIIDNGIDTLCVGSGKIATDITVAGNDVITQSEQMASAYINFAKGTISSGVSLALSATDDVTSAGLSATTAIANIAHNAMAVASAKRAIPQSIGSGSGFGQSYTHQTPYIKVLRPAISIPAAYKHTVGYVCNRTYKLSDLAGFTVCANPDLSGISATQAELDMIGQILTSGIYL